ncbi:flagellar biosynthesis protein FliQ [Timonella senegalensis]|uniref:flagellar biosynthesis protein FliQ n=1 Tax=Timonella senegalensis TaxID=1465825 RepID=UPI0002DEA9D4|nr:flagellar biosynthesis protein FliQ [Timonella senegalensis]
MDTSLVLELGLQALILAAKLAAPVLLTALVVGFTISLLQSITQVQEVTLSFVPKMIAVALVLLFAGNWMMSESVQFFHMLFERLPELIESPA